MKLFNIFKTESTSFWKNKIKIVALLAVILIPLLYSFSYLKAYWNPYGNLKDFHVAVVNNDSGATLNNEKVNYGNDTVKKLRDKTNIGFQFVNSKDANTGINDNKYFALIEIPKDFSEKIANAKNGKVLAPTIKYVSNNKENYIGTKISENIKDQIIVQIKQTIAAKYGETAFDSIYKSRDGLKDAESGTDKIINGTNDILKGNTKISSSLNVLNNQVPKLQSGTNSLAIGSSALNNGLGKLNSQVPTIANAVGKLSSGSDTLNEGLAAADNGAATLSLKSKGLTEASDGINNAYNKTLLPGYGKMTSQLKTGADTLNGVATKVNNGVTQLVQSTTDSQKEIIAAQSDLQAYLEANKSAANDPNMKKYLSVMKQISNSASSDENTAAVKQLKAGTTGLVQGTKDLSDQLNTSNSSSAASAFNSGLNKFNLTALQPFTTGVNQYTAGTDKLAIGLSALSQGSNKVSTGLGTLKTNMPTLTSASSQLYNGSSTLNNGINELNNKLPALASGSQQLASGSNKLGNALTTLNTGHNDLKTGLTNGINKINNNVKSPSKDLGTFIGDPVKTSETNIDKINNYGTGLAPYFLPISLWLGAVLMMLILKVKRDSYKDLSRVEFVIGKYIHYSLIGIVQAVLLGFVTLSIGISPTHPVMFFGLLIVMALSFDAILYALVSLLGLVGEGAAIVLLVLQLCSDGGTFPLETLPKFFQNISHLLPFTYSVQATRELLFAQSINKTLLLKDLGVLLVFGLVSLTIALIFVNKGEKINNHIEKALES
ncbi:YhgE/Pip domain-containing protein [Clostridium estertheticum]|uniref:YhgE/Pip domain-containing protein n=1 Tax=Clostridium estertheticum TaxID=238834 RepID=UPI001C7DA2EF|nr:YhgE/Pip domain-containing protein [Clostridium estertheticum]MBX4258441.1 YhgE/Pip domain-containing protein [Clostridium estertheticum]WLC69607.1 YhgE/Pip domain-containing protein [Clostridium estertheticum]